MGLSQDTWTKVKKLVNARDGGKCLRCLGEATQVHHRIPRGMGGSSDPERNYGLANLVSLCTECHDWAHSHPEDAYASGFLLHWWDVPEKFPLTVRPGSFHVQLTDGGEMIQLNPVTLF